ncbi:MAG: hypothetical protein AAGI23_09070 [Bacteroidota bacterium]
MCKHCFEEDIDSFPSEQFWLAFDLKLTQKLVAGKMKYIRFVSDGKLHKDDGYYLYQCLHCQQKWTLKDPDYSFRGYFTASE